MVQVQLQEWRRQVQSEQATKNIVQQQVAGQKHTEGMESWKNGQSGDFALSQVKKADIESAIAANAQKNELQQLGMNKRGCRSNSCRCVDVRRPNFTRSCENHQRRIR